MKKSNIIVAAALVASFGLVGCGGGGGGSSSESASTTTVQGTAVDPELVGSIVCLDNDNNGICDGVSVKTNMDGNYSITVNTSDIEEGATLLVKGGYDRVTKMPFVGTMTAMINENSDLAKQMITPLTTLVYERAMAVPETMEEAQQEVADLLGLTYDEVQANMLELTNNAALKAAMAMQQAAELAAEANDTRAFYRAMATGMMPQGQSADFLDEGEAQSDLAALMAAVADSNLSGAEQLRVKYFAQAMDVMNTVSNSELYAMGVEKMQEMIADMNTTGSGLLEQLDTGFNSVSNFVGTIMVTSPDEVEMYVTEHLLQAAGVAQPIIDEVAPVIVDNVTAMIDVETSFNTMLTMMTSYESEIKTALGNVVPNIDDVDAKYAEMIAQVTAMRDAFEPAS